MAKRLDDEDRRPGEDGELEDRGWGEPAYGRLGPAGHLAGFVADVMLGGLLPFGWELSHKGYDLERLVGQTYMGIVGLFGVPRTWPPPASCCSPSGAPPTGR
jgi:hypothetical protein